MLYALQWWHWVVFGIVLMLSELAIPSFFVIWFGFGALLVGLLLVALPDLSLTAQLGVWTVASVAMVFLWFRVFRPGFQRTGIGQSDGEIIGEPGLLVVDVAPYARGRVRFPEAVARLGRVGLYRRRGHLGRGTDKGCVGRGQFS